MSTFCVGVHINCTHAEHYYANITCKLHTLMHDALCIRTFNTKARLHQERSNLGSTKPTTEFIFLRRFRLSSSDISLHQFELGSADHG